MSASQFKSQDTATLTIWAVLALQLAGCADATQDTGEDLDVPAESGPEWRDLHDHDTPNAARSSAPAYHLPMMSGERYQAGTYSGHGHAWDFNIPGSGDCGEPVVAITNGKVDAVVATCDDCTTGYGNYVRIDHDSDAYKSRYAHLAEVYVRHGQWVERGQVLGTIGSNGYSTGCHIHLQVESGGSSIPFRIKHYSGGSKRTSTPSNTSWYTSYNHGKIQSRRTSLGKSRVGSPTSVTASRVASDGWVKYYSGGSWGSNAIYYQALGCAPGDYCTSYNNTNAAWNVRHGFYSYYHSCGGPSGCWLGWPTGNEYSTSSGSRQNFENGYLTWTSSGGVVAH